MKTLLFIFMTIAMLLWFLSTLRRKPCQKKGCIDAIIPAYNEGACLAQSLDNLLRNPYFCRVICVNDAAACPNLPGQELLVGIQKGLLIKRGTGKELLQGSDILFTGKVKGNWLNRFAFQRAQKPLYKSLEQPSLWLLGKTGKIILKIVFQFRLE